MDKELINDERIFLDMEFETKEQLLQFMVNKLESEGIITDGLKFCEDISQRESVSLTAIGDDIAFPHAQSDYVTSTILAFGRNKKKILWDADTGITVNLIFLFAVKKDQDNLNDYITSFSKVARKLTNKNNIELLQTINEVEKIKELLND